MGELEPVADEFDIDDHELAIGNVSGVGPSTALDMIDSIERDDEVADDEFIESAPGAMTGLRALNHLADRDDFDGIDRVRGRHAAIAADSHTPLRQGSALRSFTDRAVEAGLIPADDCETDIATMPGLKPADARAVFDLIGGGEAVGTDDIRAAVDIDDMLQIQEIAATIRETHGGNAEGVARDRGQEASEDQFGP